jgi:endonuclease/exonuclease/phosphatase (EEP) superfamily protein YafD
VNKLIALIGSLTALAAAFGLLARYVSPQLFWPPAIVALLLPALLLLTALYLALQLVRRRYRMAVLPGLVVLASLPLLGHLFAFPAPTVPIASGTSAPTLSVLTANQRFYRDAWGNGVEEELVRRTAQAYDADVLMLQEVRALQYPDGTTYDLGRILGYPDRHQLVKTYLGTLAEELTPVAAHFTPPNEYNGYLVTDVDTELGTIRFINAHLESNQISGMTKGIGEGNAVSSRLKTFGNMLAGYGRATRRRAEQAAEIRRAVEESPHPVVVGGDFNDVPSSFTYKEMLSPRLYDIWTEHGYGLGTTFTGPLPGLRIDYLLVDTSLSVVEVERLESPWSDHRPLRAVLTK